MLKKIYTKNAPEAIGPYSQAIQYDKLLFSSGQIPVDPENGEIVAGGIAAQAEQVMKKHRSDPGKSRDRVCFRIEDDLFSE